MTTKGNFFVKNDNKKNRDSFLFGWGKGLNAKNATTKKENTNNARVPHIAIHVMSRT